MFKKSMRFAAVFLAVICLAASLLGVSAATQVPFESYTYWEDIGEERKAVYSRPMYETQKVINNLSLGVGAFTTINDVYSDDKNVFILDNASRIVILDNKYNLVNEIGVITDSKGNTYDYTGAMSLYVHTDGSIFISDTENQRVLAFLKSES